jgi:hypothetical protein
LSVDLYVDSYKHYLISKPNISPILVMSPLYLLESNPLEPAIILVLK